MILSYIIVMVVMCCTAHSGATTGLEIAISRHDLSGISGDKGGGK